LAGSQLSLNWQNINTFRGAEFFKLSLNGNFELQVGGNKASEYRDNYRLGADAQFNIPRFVAPFIKIDPEESKVLPKTQIKLGYESFIKTGLYNLNSSSFNFNYIWLKGKRIEQSFSPLSINFVKSSNLSYAFTLEVFSNPALLSVLDNQLIVGANYEFKISSKPEVLNKWNSRSRLDLAGTLFGVINLIRNDKQSGYSIFGERLSQYIKFEEEIVKYLRIKNDNYWVNRFFIGFGIPYGHSLKLPFVSQYYVGGNNSLRGFRARSLGPGNYETKGTIAESYLGSNFGDVKLEFNSELRQKLSTNVELAFFVDGGNVWLFKDKSFYEADVLFSKYFYKQLALDAGVGLRYNLSFIIARIDIGTPIIKPWISLNNRMETNDFRFSNKEWRKNNIIWNFAIGMPF
jgi:hypothetical protein